VKNEALDVAAVVAQYQQEVAGLKAQLAALSGEVDVLGGRLHLEKAPFLTRTCTHRAGAAASAGGALSPDVLQAMHASLASSSNTNQAEQLEDQAAQLRYLQVPAACVASTRVPAVVPTRPEP
jgi:hypothetical protein